jgi:hypothetical protein
MSQKSISLNVSQARTTVKLDLGLASPALRRGKTSGPVVSVAGVEPAVAKIGPTEVEAAVPGAG